MTAAEIAQVLYWDDGCEGVAIAWPDPICCGGDPYEYVISANIRRRHLTKEQQAGRIVAVLAKLSTAAGLSVEGDRFVPYRAKAGETCVAAPPVAANGPPAPERPEPAAAPTGDEREAAEWPRKVSRRSGRVVASKTCEP
jgi:hypothetical protein